MAVYKGMGTSIHRADARYEGLHIFPLADFCSEYNSVMLVLTSASKGVLQNHRATDVILHLYTSMTAY
jgi:hypothetical protein